MTLRAAFWDKYALDELNPGEWEALCDGCGRCCLKTFSDVDNEDILRTNVACSKLNLQSCRCRCYATRQQEVADCIDVARDVEDWNWMPATCAYRLRAENKPLFAWHPLVSGNAASVHKAGISVRGKVLSEENVHPQQLEQHIVQWVG